MADRNGVPLTVVLTAANVHDSKVFEELVDATGPIKHLRKGRPRRLSVRYERWADIHEAFLHPDARSSA